MEMEMTTFNICYINVSGKNELSTSILHTWQIFKTEILSPQHLKKGSWNVLIKIAEKKFQLILKPLLETTSYY